MENFTFTALIIIQKKEGYMAKILQVEIL